MLIASALPRPHQLLLDDADESRQRLRTHEQLAITAYIL
jgi:hypothetical protein